MVRNRHRAAGAALPARLPSIRSLSGPVAAPKAPRGLKAPGKDAWALTWTEAGSWLTDADRVLVVRLAQLVDEMAAYRAALTKHGAVVAEPVVTPRGDVVGTKLAANPAAKQLHDAGVELAALTKSLGLSPDSRARLGLTAARTRREVTAADREGRDGG